MSDRLGFNYIPSTTEKKRAISCFLFFGLIMSLVSQKKFSEYEYYYLTSSVGWWMVGSLLFLLFLFSLVFPFFLLLSLPFAFAWSILGLILVYNAWNGKFGNTFSLFLLFQGIGSWLVSLFDVQLQKK